MGSTAPDTHAVIIGLDFYPNSSSDGRLSLHGCVNDARKFEARMKDYLTRRGVAEADFHKYLTVLTSTPKAPATYRPYISAEQAAEEPLATAENIIQAILNASVKAKKDDIVFISYSGHGGRQPTVVKDWPGKTSELDETLCPWDVEKAGDSGLSIRDFVLNYLFKLFVDKGVKLTVLLDSCHSGGATRAPLPDAEGDADPVLIRSMPAAAQLKREISEEDYWARSGPLRLKKAEIQAAWAELMERTTQSPGAGAALRPLGYSLFTGCLEHEYSGENYGAGFLSSAAADALDTLAFAPAPERVSLGHIQRHIFDKVYGPRQHPTTREIFLQSPLLLGDPARPFPMGPADVIEGATALAPTAPTAAHPIAVHALPPTTGSRIDTPPTLLLRAGTMHGVQAGSEYAVFRWFDDAVPSQAEVRVVVKDVRSTTSVVALAAPLTTIPDAWKALAARQVELQNSRQTTTINYKTGLPYPPLNPAYPWPTGCVAVLVSGPPAAARTVRIAGDIPGLTAQVYYPGEVPLMFVAEDAQADEHYRLARDAAGGYTVLGPKGAALQVPVVARTLPSALESIAHIDRYSRLLAINRPTYSYVFSFNITESTKHLDGTRLNKVNFTWLRAYSSEVNKVFANIAVFHFSPDYAVRKVYPIDGEFESLDPADQRNFSFEGSGGKLKAVVFWASTSFEWWQMGPVGTRGSVDGVVEGKSEEEPALEPAPVKETAVGVPPTATTFRDPDQRGFEVWLTKEVPVKSSSED
ncbi:caspase domain-containing protein [Peziza echinospora]|nr:caspase domain-containing protein [Peziza echinospora]